MAPPNASNINIIQCGVILNDIFWNSVTEKTFNTRRQGSATLKLEITVWTFSELCYLEQNVFLPSFEGRF